MEQQGKTLKEFFRSAERAGVALEVHIDHPNPEFQRQLGICYAAHQEFMVIGPEGSPARVCLPYAAIRWFRRQDDLV